MVQRPGSSKRGGALLSIESTVRLCVSRFPQCCQRRAAAIRLEGRNGPIRRGWYPSLLRSLKHTSAKPVFKYRRGSFWPPRVREAQTAPEESCAAPSRLCQVDAVASVWADLEISINSLNFDYFSNIFQEKSVNSCRF